MRPRPKPAAMAALILTGVIGACATSPTEPPDPSPEWDRPQPRCFFDDALAAGIRLGQEGLAGAPGESGRLTAASKGSIDGNEVNKVIQSHLEEVKYCYRRGLATDRMLKGRINLRFTVGVAGRVLTSSVASSTVANEDVGTCVGRAVCRWVFEEPRGANTMVINYPFELNQIARAEASEP